MNDRNKLALYGVAVGGLLTLGLVNGAEALSLNEEIVQAERTAGSLEASGDAQALAQQEAYIDSLEDDRRYYASMAVVNLGMVAISAPIVIPGMRNKTEAEQTVSTHPASAA